MRRHLQNLDVTTALIANNALLQEKLGAQASGFIKAQLQELKRLKQEQDDADIKGVELSFHLCDHLGTPNALIDQYGSVIWAARLDAWGNVREEFNLLGHEHPIRLPGQHQDLQTGLLYSRHCYYDPVIEVYINQDPIGLAGGVQKCRYSFQPLRSIDPLGLDTYIVNGNPQVFGNSARSRWDPITHTFSATTNPDGSIARTYSWGNESNLKGWSTDQELDLKAAKEAINRNKAEK